MDQLSIVKYKGITEIFSMFLKRIIVNVETKWAKVFDEKYGDCSSVPFSEWVDLPNTWNKGLDMGNNGFFI